MEHEDNHVDQQDNDESTHVSEIVVKRFSKVATRLCPFAVRAAN